MKGENCKNIEKYVNSTFLKELTERKLITINQYNQQYFSGDGEEVKLTVDVKNIPKLTVSVYEVNIENYYIDKLAPFDNGISLEGIIPIEVTEYDNSGKTPILKETKEFAFPSITK